MHCAGKAIKVNAVNDAPVAANDSATTDEDTPITIPVLSNDSDVDGDSLALGIFTGATHGTVSDRGDGTFEYTPNKDYNGNYSDGQNLWNMRWRHLRNDAANFVFADGHAETKRLKFGLNAEITARNIYVNPMR